MIKFISFLGPTKYIPGRYQMDGFTSEFTYYVQHGIIDILLKTGMNIDEAVIFTTEEAYNENYLKNAAEESKPGLKSYFENSPLKDRFKNVMIPEVKKEAEIWELFELVYNEIDEGDEVIFDLTHSFRYIPLLAFIVLSYAGFLKSSSIKAVYYGALEALGKPGEVADMPEELRLIPVFDMTGVVELFQWSVGIDRYITAADVSKVYDLAQKGINKIKNHIKVTSNDKEAFKATSLLKNMVNCMKKFNDSIYTCRGPELEEKAIKLIKSIEEAVQVWDDVEIKPFRPLVEKVRDEFSKITGNENRDFLFFSEFCLRYGLIQQGLTLLEEGIISYICDRLGMEKFDKNDRGKITAYAHNILKNEHIDEIQQFISSSRKDLFLLLYNLADIRNDINHAGWNKGPRAPEKFKSALKDYIERTRDLLTDEQLQNTAPGKTPKRMLLVFSHQLTEEQKKEAIDRFGVREFLKLPPELQRKWSAIPPELDSLNGYLEDILDWIEENGHRGDIALIEGDFGATMLAVNYCRRLGIIPVYAASERKVEEERYNDVVVAKRTFKHVRFREYGL